MADCKSIYNCIFSHPTLATLEAISSMVHMKLKYHSHKDVIDIIDENLKACNTCFLPSLLIHQEKVDTKGKGPLVIKDMRIHKRKTLNTKGRKM